MNVKKILPVALFTGMAATGFAQRAADFKKSGDHYYAEGNYYSAAYYYQQYLEGSSTAEDKKFMPNTVTLMGRGYKKSTGNRTNADPQLLFRIAESYRMINDYNHAEKYYEELSQVKSDQYADAMYWYAVSLRANGKYSDARERFKEYVRTAGNQANYANAAKLELQNLAYLSDQQKRPDLTLYSVTKLEAVNSPETNYAATYVGNSLVFTSTRPDAQLQQQGKNPYTNALYTNQTGSVQKLGVPQSDDMQQGIASFSPDGNTVYLTKWTKDHGQNVSAIYTSQKTGSTWSEPRKLNAQVNVAGANAMQPSVTSDGQYLLFASDRPGGLGKFDIWAAPLSNGEPGTPFNLGAMINTSEDDEAPFYHQPSQTLVFASKGRVGLGGFDLYQTKGVLGGNKWNEAENLGYPVNSNKDDIYFSTNSNQLLKNAVISSDRFSDYCMAILSVNKKYRKYIAGTVVDCKTQQALGNVNVSFGGAGSLHTDENGKYVLEVTDFNSMTLTASKENYQNGSFNIHAPQTGDVDTLYNEVVCLNPVEKHEPPKPAVEKDVYFDFAKYNLRPETQVVMDTLASILKREGNLKLIITGYTDGVGTDEYNMKLSGERADACKAYLVSKGVPANRIETVAKGECCPVKPETTPDGKDDPEARQMNRRVEFDIKLSY